MGLHPNPNMAWNPQSNAILERIHQVFGNFMQLFDLDEVELHPEDPWEEYIMATAYALRSRYHTTL